MEFKQDIMPLSIDITLQGCKQILNLVIAGLGLPIGLLNRLQAALKIHAGGQLCLLHKRIGRQLVTQGRYHLMVGQVQW